MTMDAPYRFIPISAWIHEPSWGGMVSQDLPSAVGVSGWLDFSIIARTPILVGGHRIPRGGNAETDVHFYRLPDGRFAIPGSGLRGVIRSVLEIAAFGRAAFVDDARYRLRDLSGPSEKLYRSRVTPKNVQSGWLHPPGADGRIRIQPCTWARVHVSELARKLGIPDSTWNGVAVPRNRGHSVEERYEILTSRGLGLEQSFYIRGSEPGELEALCESSPGDRQTEGTLVFSAKPGYGTPRQKGRKNREFFFFNPEPDAENWLPVSKADMETFRFVNSWDEGRREKISPERRPAWRYWKERLERGEKVPVFYILRLDGSLDCFGHSMLFVMAHGESTARLLDNARRGGAGSSEPRHRDAWVRDLPTLLFGRASDAEEKADVAYGLKGRVVFEPAVATAAPDVLERRIKPVGPIVLASPKAQFFPAYVQQPRDGDRLVGGLRASYASYTPQADEGQKLVQSPELAGRKRYPVREAVSAQQPDGQISKLIQSVLHPLPAGTRFAGRVRFHNIREEELGAIVWALRLWAPCWGTRPGLWHAIGAGKSLGLGGAEIALTNARIEANKLQDGKRYLLAPRPDVDLVAAAEAYADHFVTHMEAAYIAAPGNGRTAWAASEQVEMLLAMADPKLADTRLRTMSLDEFAQAKNERAVLPLPKRRAASTDGQPVGSTTEAEVFSRTHPMSPPGVTQVTGGPRRASTDRSGTSVSRPPAGDSKSAPRFRVGESVYYDEWDEDGVIQAVLPGSPPRYRLRFANGAMEVVAEASLRQVRR